MFKIESKFRKCQKKKKTKKEIEKMIFVSEINSSENVAINMLSKEENTCYQQSMGQQTVLRFCISLRETFSN